MSYEFIRLDLEDNVAVLTIDRPDRLNALTPGVFDEMTAAIDDAVEKGARALIITGEGRAFCSGADLAARGAAGLPADLGLIVDKAYNPFAIKLANLDIPVITAINGLAAGAGASLAMSGDISVIARSAYLLLAFVNIGLVPDAGATWMVAQSLGRTRALEMALLGEKLPAEEAKAAGLVTRVVDDEAVLEEAKKIAKKLASGATFAINLIRKQVATALTSSLTETLMTERNNQGRAGKTQDFREAVAAFGEKRPPVFKGQ